MADTLEVEFAAKHLGTMTVRGHFGDVSSVADN
jgi:polyisoprenoid-binding protein YceI